MDRLALVVSRPVGVQQAVRTVLAVAHRDYTPGHTEFITSAIQEQLLNHPSSRHSPMSTRLHPRIESVVLCRSLPPAGGALNLEGNCSWCYDPPEDCRLHSRVACGLINAGLSSGLGGRRYMAAKNQLLTRDQAHWIHPLHDPKVHENAHVWVKGEGAILTDADGKQYIDGLAGLWNVVAGHGRQELAEAAAGQMMALPYCSGYAGHSNLRLSNWRNAWPVWPIRPSTISSSRPAAGRQATAASRWLAPTGSCRVIRRRRRSYRGNWVTTVSRWPP